MFGVTAFVFRSKEGQTVGEFFIFILNNAKVKHFNFNTYLDINMSITRWWVVTYKVPDFVLAAVNCTICQDHFSLKKLVPMSRLAIPLSSLRGQ